MDIDPRLMDLLNKVGDEALRKKMVDLLSDLSLRIGGREFKGIPLSEAPASRLYHHSYPGGLIDHILSMCNIASALCDSVEKIYGGEVNRDYVICGIILHDIFKPLTYEVKSDGGYIFSQIGERIDHLTLIVSELIRRDFPVDLIHVVLASHGEGSPVSPRTIEALICHIADEADSKLNGGILNAAKYLVKEATGETWERMDTKTAMKIIALKAKGGWEGLKVGIEDIKRESRTKLENQQ